MWQDFVNSLYGYAAWLVPHALFLGLRIVFDRAEIRERLKAFGIGVLFGALAVVLFWGGRYFLTMDLFSGMSYDAHPFLSVLAGMTTLGGIVVWIFGSGALFLMHMVFLVPSWLFSDWDIRVDGRW